MRTSCMIGPLSPIAFRAVLPETATAPPTPETEPRSSLLPLFSPPPSRVSPFLMLSSFRILTMRSGASGMRSKSSGSGTQSTGFLARSSRRSLSAPKESRIRAASTLRLAAAMCSEVPFSYSPQMVSTSIPCKVQGVDCSHYIS